MSIFELFAQTYPRLLQGLWMTIELTLVSLLIAAVLGLLITRSLDDDRIDPGIAADCGGARASLWFVICFKDYFFTGNFTCIH